MEWWSFGSWVLLLISACVFKAWAVKRENGGERDDEGFVIPRGSWGWPLIGETLDFIASGYTSKPVSFMEKRKSLYGDVFRTHILGKAIVVSTDPEVSKVILQDHGNAFVPSYPKSVTDLLGKSSILETNGALHKRIHSLIGVFLKSTQLKDRITRDIENIVRLSLSSWTDKNCRVYFQDEVKKTTFEILVRVLMSMGPGDEMESLKREFQVFINGLICLPVNLPGTTLYKSLKAKKRLLKMVDKIAEARRSDMEKNGEKGLPNDVLDVLLRTSGDSDEMQQQRTPLDSISGIIEMMIPGEETVPTAITLAVKFLVDNPVALAHFVVRHLAMDASEFAYYNFFVQNKLLVPCMKVGQPESMIAKLMTYQDENTKLRKGKIQSNEEYSWSDYMSLSFTQNVISETLRLANIVNAVWRKALKDVKIKGYLIPKGWCVMTSFSSIHMDESNYKNPYEFDPWRWEKVGPVAYSNIFTPFGGGQRLCPGMELARLEISIFLHHLFTTYRLSVEEDEIIYFPTVRMKRKLPITVTPLEQFQPTKVGSN